ncbi:MAG TPA: hypothetical protein DCZ63_06725 [Geobacter sp.]|nr:hypothetical protein [Geobacter sp.]
MHSKIIFVVLSLFVLFVTVSASAAPGQLDPNFNGSGIAASPPFSGKINAIVRQTADDMLVVAGSRFNGTGNEFVVARYSSGGTLDTLFGNSGWVSTAQDWSSEALAVALQPDGMIVVAGFANDSMRDNIALVRYTAAGAPDMSFGTNGVVRTAIPGLNSRAQSVAVDASGRILVAGYAENSGFALLRYTSAGVLDTTFGNNGVVTTLFRSGSDLASCLAIQGDGKIVVAGNSSDGYFLLARYSADGNPDSQFGFGGSVLTSVGISAGLQGIALQPDGKIVVAGLASNFPSRDIVVARYTDSGSLDSTFNSNGMVTTDINGGDDTAYGVALQSNGRIVVAGSSSNFSGEQLALLRYESDGRADYSFGASGRVLTSVNLSSTSRAQGLLIQPDGRIVAAGYYINGNDNLAVARYLGDVMVTFAAGAHGTVNGDLLQTADVNGNTTSVTAVADSGYHFVNWTGTGGFAASSSNPLSLSNVTENMTVTANFAADPLVTFVSGAHGTVSGALSQTIVPNGQTTQVTAVADANYHFVNWTGTGGFPGDTANPLTVMNVTNDMTITANFAIDTRNIQFIAGTGGSISGATLQTVNYGGSTSAVTAVPESGYALLNWTGPAGFATTSVNPLTVSNITGDMTITANFRDFVPPLISSFILPATSSTQYASPLAVTATDNVGVASYCFSEDNSTPPQNSACWIPAVPAGFNFAGGGTRTLYLWVRDAAGNISASRYASISIQDTAAPYTEAYPAETVFTVPFNVTLLSSKPATIHYTTDASTPTVSSAVYAGPLPISGSFTLKFFARGDNGASESVKTIIYKRLSAPLATTPVNGPFGNSGIGRVVTSPAFASDRTLIADQWGTWYISADSGATWQRFASRYRDMEFSPAFASDRTMFAVGAGNAGYQLLLKSSDSGASWHAISTMPVNSQLMRVSPTYAEDATLFAFGFGSFSRSTNGGLGWVQLTGLPVAASVSSVAFSPTYASDHTILLGTSKGVYRSRDAGLTWNRINDSIAGSNVAQAVTIAPDGAYFVSFNDVQPTTTGNKIYKSSDSGAVWTAVTPSATMSTVYDIKASPNYANDSTLFAATYSNSIFKSTDKGSSWSSVKSEPFDVSPGYSIAISPAYSSDSQLFVGTYDRGVVRSINGGSSWSASSYGIIRQGSSFVLSPAFQSDQTIFAPVGGIDKIAKSSDGGNSWSALPNLAVTSPIFSFAVSPAYSSDSTFWAGSYANIYKSSDGGISWIEHPAGYMNTKIVVSPGYATDHTLFTISGYGALGIFKSVNGGDSWAVMNTGLSDPTASDLVVSPGYATDQTAFAVAGGVLYKTTNGGSNWAPVTTPAAVSTVLLSPAYPGDQTILLSLSTGEACISNNNGSAWSTLPALIVSGYADALSALAFSPAYAQDGTIFAGGNLGLYRISTGQPEWLHVPLDNFRWASGASNYVHSIVPSPAFASDRTLFLQSTDGPLKVVIPVPTAPGITSFEVPATSATLTATPITLSATDNLGVTGFCLREVNSSSGCSWSATAPTSYTFASFGQKSLYAWVRDAAGNISATAFANLAVGNPLTLTIAGSGTGSTSGGISCTSGTCKAAYNTGTTVNISATATPGSFFAGWSGACGGTGNCSTTVNSSGYLVATFMLTLNARNLNSGDTFLPLQTAYNAAESGDVIQSRAVTFIEDLLFNRPVEITIRGGYDTNYLSAAGVSTVQGKVVIQSGSLIADGILIR